MAAPKYIKLDIKQLPKDDQGHAAVNFYVHLPSASRYLCYIAKGDAIDPEKLASLKNHAVPELYRREDEALAEATVTAPDPELPKDFQQKILGAALNEELGDVYKLFKGGGADPGETVKRFEGMSDKLVGSIAPDVKTLNDHLKKQIQYLHLMSDAAAISTLSIICAYANGFDSRKSYRELSYATLVMDISLAEFTTEQIHKFYVERDSLPEDTVKAMMLHPMKSYQLAETKLKSLSDVTMQLILNHHELYNGKGYPRSIRTEALFPIARVLSLAVDAFERLKVEQHLKSKRGLIDVFQDLRDELVDAHMRRHNKKIIDATIEFLTREGAVAPPRPTI